MTVSIDGNVPTSFPPHTFTVEDLEGTEPAAWDRVCDIHVASDGTAHIMDPDTTNTALTPWHYDGVNGLQAPEKGAKKIMR